jgi:hypothetical protein
VLAPNTLPSRSSSAVERLVYTELVGGSIPSSCKLSLQIDYLEQFHQLGRTKGKNGMLKLISARHDLCRTYSFAIPNRQAVNALARLSPLVELGAGTGYWAMLIAQAGATIQAYDKAPGAKHPRNNYKFSQNYTNVLAGNETVLDRMDPQYNLFLCWPNYNTDFAYNCLQHFRGTKFAYIGENRGGCTGNDKFFDLLEKNWKAQKAISIPRWPGIHDSLTIFTKIIP